jgi:hypothetical protein
MKGIKINKAATGAVAGLILAFAPAFGQQYADGAAGDDGTGLTLICWGQGRKPTSTVSPGYAWNGDSNKFVPKTYVHNSTQRFDSEVQVELYGDAGRIHLTGKLIPPTHSGGSNGWWPLNDVQMTPEKITARYRMNGINKPKVEIDRRTGRIKIDGIEKFKGECDQGNWGQRGERF